MPEEKSYVDHSNSGQVITGMVYSPEEVQGMDEAQLVVAADDSFYVQNPAINTKVEAVEASTNRYWKGVPCKNNHISDRYLKGQCIQCFREAVKRKRQTEHGKEVYQAARKRAMDRKRERKLEAQAPAE